MKPTNSAEIRQAFLDFFMEMGHEIVPSSPLPMYDNPTLLFTNAGMNQFVDTFLGKEERPYKRAASSQKCMRVQGKHNDLENVGPSPRHHTFFEMLGNFSFGDYFKAGAIRYAYDFLTRVCQIPAEQLWYTVHVDDEDAYGIWINEIGVPEDRVLRMGDKTNFWMMGEIGPCGPTSEVHYDWGPEYCTCDEPNCSIFLDNDCGRWLELWNLVFMQFNQEEDGTRIPLPKPGVDTGLGLERLATVIEQEPANYDTDLFMPAMDRIQELLGDTDEERERHQTAYRVIADHGRAATFLIADGVLPGNVGQGYVLRMIIRRAARFGRKISFADPFMAVIADVFIETMGDVYTEIKTHREHIKHTLTLEEKRFARTLDEALVQLKQVLDDLNEKGCSEIPGKVAFNLYATHGLPLEITRDIATEQGFSVDESGFDEARKAHAEASGAGAFGKYDTGDRFYADLMANLVEQGDLEQTGVDYDPYNGATMESTVVGLVSDGKIVESASAGMAVEIVTSATPYYVESGGEVSDTGWLRVHGGGKIYVNDVKEPVPGLIVHLGEVRSGQVTVGQLVTLDVDDERRWDIRRNHTATHILHRQLRSKLGEHVTQQGSLVAPDRLRFDFSYGQAVDDQTLSEIEESINDAIIANRRVVPEYMPKEDAISKGAMALFGEKYGDIVRTIRIGAESDPYSFELCGGLHVNATGDIGFFRFTSEEAVGAGLRRVEAVTGRGAYQHVKERLQQLEDLAVKLSAPTDELDTRLDSLLGENRKLQKELANLRRSRAKSQFESLLNQMQSVLGIMLMRGVVDVADMDGLREMADWFRDQVESGVAVLASIKDGRPILIVAVTDDLVKEGINAGNLIGEIARRVGGGGGGRPTLAQAGGKDAHKLPDALDAVPELLRQAHS